MEKTFSNLSFACLLCPSHERFVPVGCLVTFMAGLAWLRSFSSSQCRNTEKLKLTPRGLTEDLSKLLELAPSPLLRGTLCGDSAVAVWVWVGGWVGVVDKRRTKYDDASLCSRRCAVAVAVDLDPDNDDNDAPGDGDEAHGCRHGYNYYQHSGDGCCGSLLERSRRFGLV